MNKYTTDGSRKHDCVTLNLTPILYTQFLCRTDAMASAIAVASINIALFTQNSPAIYAKMVESAAEVTGEPARPYLSSLKLIYQSYVAPSLYRLI